MPILATFYGMIIRIYHGDHNPPHFHVEYGEHEIWVEIKTGKVLRGNFPRRLRHDIETWRRLHIRALLVAWEDAQNLKRPKPIKPLG